MQSAQSQDLAIVKGLVRGQAGSWLKKAISMAADPEINSYFHNISKHSSWVCQKTDLKLEDT